MDKVDSSRISDSFYFYVSHPSNAADSVKIRFSDHEDKHGGNSGTVFFGDTLRMMNQALDMIESGLGVYGDLGQDNINFSIRTKEPPKKTGIGYKVFYRGKDGKLYPPMVANPDGADTPVGVWLDADEGVRVADSKTGRAQVKAGGKGTQGGSGTLSFRPGWHLGEIPYAIQFNRVNPLSGKKELFPRDFVWAEVEYAADVDYQDEAMSYGYTDKGKFRHSYAGLPHLPKDGFYTYRTNPNPETDPWIITGAMKVNRVLSQSEVDEIVRNAGREPQRVEGASFALKDNQVKIGNKGVATFKDGVVRNASAHVLNENGSEVWGHVPYVDELAQQGFSDGDIYMEVGNLRYGYLHILHRHGAEIKALYADIPLHLAVNSFIKDVFNAIERLHIDRPYKKGNKAKNYLSADSREDISSGQKKFVSLLFKQQDKQYKFMTMFSHDANSDKFGDEGITVMNDGLELKLLVTPRGVERADLPVGENNKPLSSLMSDSRHHSLQEDSITVDSAVKAEDIEYNALRVAKHYEQGARFKGQDGQGEAIVSFALKQRADGSRYVLAEGVVNSTKEAYFILKEKMLGMTEQVGKSTQRRGVPGKGLVAPGTDYEVFIMKSGIESMLSYEHIKPSLSVAPQDVHSTAVSLVDELWMASEIMPDRLNKRGEWQLGEQVGDKKNPNNGNLKMIHRRLADLVMPDGKVYEVKLTAKEYSNKNDTNTLYMLEIEGIKEKSTETKMLSASIDVQVSSRESVDKGSISDSDVVVKRGNLLNSGQSGVSYALRDDVRGRAQGLMRVARSELVRDYWGSVLSRLEDEGKALDVVFKAPESSHDRLRVKLAEARAALRVAVQTLPGDVRGKLERQERQLRAWMGLLEQGLFDPHKELKRADVERLAAEMGIDAGEMPYYVGRKIDEIVLKAFNRAGEVINLYVRDGLFKEAEQMIRDASAVVDESTRKFKVSRLGAKGTEFLRRVIKPAVLATAGEAEAKAKGLMERLEFIENALSADGEGGRGDLQALMVERERVSHELSWWLNYSAGRSSDVERMMGIHAEVQRFIHQSSTAWEALLADKVDGWKSAGKALRDELPVEVDQRSMHRAEMELTELGTDGATGRRKKGVIFSWLENPVRMLERLSEGPGGKFFGKFLREFLNVTHRTQYMRSAEQGRMHDVLMSIAGVKNERGLNAWLADWDKKVDLGLMIGELGFRRTKLTIEQTAELLEKRKENTWYGYAMLTM